MAKYRVFDLQNKVYDYLIVANSYENPINEFLAQGGVPDVVEGKILFDLTLVNGIKSNRYVIATVSNNKIDFFSIKPIENIDRTIFKISQDYFVGNPHIVENSSLPKALKYLILNP